ncbi:hypothetical protein DYBT9275_03170 [Dyadobacter sp. CECT 9275]|uniref:ABC transport system permease protein n=1 Tax=Dyadobacter helix TaxID=2822344 RepID=A0A916JCT7_9BACT|nr:ABC transporter permease [Dyadobacter sp. CECT 9275]CAG5003518.1 hypothetical protein DYBT9275_03170 [Dyadobacter sp. CECT 9275]
MLSNYLKIAWRTFWKNSVVGTVNLLGLSLGLAVTLLVILYVTHEYSFDRFHKNESRIVLAEFRHYEGNKQHRISTLSYGFGQTVKNAAPGVEDFGRITERDFGSKLVQSDAGHAFYEPDFRFADAGFLRLFSFELVSGDPREALSRPSTVLLTETMARKYFGDIPPIGKTITYDKTHRLEVTGVLKDPPGNSSFQFGFLADLHTRRAIEISGYQAVMNHETAKQWIDNIGTGGGYETYFLLHAHADRHKIAGLIPGLLTETEKIRGNKDSYQLLPLSELHFSLRFPGLQQRVTVFTVIGGLILILALINYVNLSTARATLRNREVSVRKVVGAARGALVIQFYLESALHVTLACGMAVLFFIVLQPLFYQTLHLKIDGSFLFSHYFLIPATLFWLVNVFLSGSYPALLLSGFVPAVVLRGGALSDRGTVKIRSSLTVFQFTISIALIIGSILMGKQLDFFFQKDTGIKRDQILTVFLDSEDGMDKHYKAVKEEIGLVKGVESVTSSNLLMYDQYMNSWQLKRLDTDLMTKVNTFPVDKAFMKTMNIRWAFPGHGNIDFSGDNRIVINEAAARELGVNAGNYRQTLDLGNGMKKEIAGVVKDFHYANLTERIQPMALFIGNDTTFRNYLYVKIARGASVPETITALKEIYDSYKKAKPFEYAFLDDTYCRMYAQEVETGRIITVLTIMAIVIAGLGLFGLATFTAERRTKEIGIRKVLGAGVAGVIMLLSKDFMKLVLIAILLATPLAWWVMHQWLERFAYKIEIEWGVFVMAGSIATGIGLLTVSFQSVKAALADPVKSLKSE